MSFPLWLGFAAASAVLLVIPGPTVLLVVSYALGQGRRSGLATVAGVALGDLTAMTASMLGLGAVLAASAAAFGVLRWVGAAYLVYLGIKLWRAPVAALEAGEASHRRMLLHAYAVTALNPKSIVFFIAFVPQFLDAARPFAPQMAVMVATFVGLAAVNAAAYALLAAGARRFFRRPSARRAINRLGGGALVGAGLLAAAWRRA